jgi:hypothetical protein
MTRRVVRPDKHRRAEPSNDAVSSGESSDLPGHTLTRPVGRHRPGSDDGGMDTEVVQLRAGNVLSVISLK